MLCAATEGVQIRGWYKTERVDPSVSLTAAGFPFHKGAKGAYRRRFSGFAVRSGSAAVAVTRHVSEYWFT